MSTQQQDDEIKELKAEQDEAVRYATHLANILHLKHWKAESPNFRTFTEITGILSQIDNMVATLIKPDELALWKERARLFEASGSLIGYWSERAHASEAEIEKLTAWKSEALAVERQWDVQAVGKLIDVPLGLHVRPHIQPAIERLLAENAELEKQKNSAVEALANLLDNSAVITPRGYDKCFVHLEVVASHYEAAYAALPKTEEEGA